MMKNPKAKSVAKGSSSVAGSPGVSLSAVPAMEVFADRIIVKQTNDKEQTLWGKRILAYSNHFNCRSPEKCYIIYFPLFSEKNT